MANEISASVSLGFTKGGVSESVTIVTTKFTMVGTNYIHNTMLVPTSITPIPKGSIGTIGWALIQNLDGSGNIMQVLAGTTNNSSLTQLNAGEFQVVRFASGAIPSVLSITGTSLQANIFLIEN